MLKDVTLEDLVDCIGKVHRGQICVQPSIAAKLAERTATPDLTERELDVLRRIVAGRSNKEIATDLDVTEGTVKSHVNRILDKLGVVPLGKMGWNWRLGSNAGGGAGVGRIAPFIELCRRSGVRGGGHVGLQLDKANGGLAIG